MPADDDQSAGFTLSEISAAYVRSAEGDSGLAHRRARSLADAQLIEPAVRDGRAHLYDLVDACEVPIFLEFQHAGFSIRALRSLLARASTRPEAFGPGGLGRVILDARRGDTGWLLRATVNREEQLSGSFVRLDAEPERRGRPEVRALADAMYGRPRLTMNLPAGELLAAFLRHLLAEPV